MAVENQGPFVAIAVFQASWAMTAKAPRNRRVATMRRWRGMGDPFVNRCPVWRYKRPSSVIARDNHRAPRGSREVRLLPPRWANSGLVKRACLSPSYAAWRGPCFNGAARTDGTPGNGDPHGGRSDRGDHAFLGRGARPCLGISRGRIGGVRALVVGDRSGLPI